MTAVPLFLASFSTPTLVGDNGVPPATPDRYDSDSVSEVRFTISLSIQASTVS